MLYKINKMVLKRRNLKLSNFVIINGDKIIF